MSTWVTCVCACCSFQRVKSTGGWWLYEHNLGSLVPAGSWREGVPLYRLDTICWLALDKRSAFLCSMGTQTHRLRYTNLTDPWRSSTFLLYIIYCLSFSKPLPAFTLSPVSFSLPLFLLKSCLFFTFIALPYFTSPQPSPPHFLVSLLSLCVLYPQLLLSFLLKYQPGSLPPVRWQFLSLKRCPSPAGSNHPWKRTH